MVLALFSIVPTVLLLALGISMVSEAVLITGAPAAWERAAATGGELIRIAERTDDPELRDAAVRHRDELSASLTQSRRWEYLLGRAVTALPIAALLLALVLGLLAFRAARAIASGLSLPIRELTIWAERVGRGERIPEPATPNEADSDEFATLRAAFRRMDAELVALRERELVAERQRTWVSMARRVAHELKNPLTPIRLAVHTLLRSGFERDPAGAEAAEVIVAEVERLDEMARAFAQFGRLPEGPTSEVDLHELLDSLLRTHLPPEIRSRIEASPALPHVRGHHDALGRAFTNLILNAAEAVGPGGGEVIVRLHRVGDAIEVVLRDSGSGIEVQPLDRIWEPDFSTRTRGTGLGLALVRQTVEAHGGAVAARNAEQGGAEFRVRLPLDFAASTVRERIAAGHSDDGDGERLEVAGSGEAGRTS
jgi:nitrogen fixation/metabolism regulation signal transduction histidine kinase